MADYYPLIARAVAGLDKNTGDARRGLYERARTALVAQLRSVDPALNESDITRERLALEEAIRKVEAESARKARVEPARAESSSKVRAPDVSRWEAAGRWDRPAESPLADPPSPPPRKARPPGRHILRRARGGGSIGIGHVVHQAHESIEGAERIALGARQRQPPRR